MIIYDFKYDGVLLSSKGYMVCTIGGNGLESASNGSKINFVTVPMRNGLYNEFITSNYSDCVTATFSICKKPCHDENIQNSGTDMEISLQDFNDLAAWLNRRKFYRLSFDHETYTHICFDASFNLTKREYNGKIYAVDLEMITNRPHAFLDEKTESKRLTSSMQFVVEDESNEEGFVYPKTKIIMQGSGTFTLSNTADTNNDVVIKNCVAGETIMLEYPMITTDNVNHRDTIANDFNWNFPRLVNTYTNKTNTYSVSVNCELTYYYYPILKIGL